MFSVCKVLVGIYSGALTKTCLLQAIDDERNDGYH